MTHGGKKDQRAKKWNPATPSLSTVATRSETSLVGQSVSEVEKVLKCLVVGLREGDVS